MRLTAVLLLVLCTGMSSHALTAEPPSPSPSPSQTAPTPERQSATAPGGEHNAGPSSPATTPAEPVVAGKPELTREEKELTSLGYKLEMRHGEKYFCRRETELGSHFELKSCNTAESIQAHRATSMEEVRKIQASGKPKGEGK